MPQTVLEPSLKFPRPHFGGAAAARRRPLTFGVGSLATVHATALALMATAVVLGRRNSAGAIDLYWLAILAVGVSSAGFMVRRSINRGQRLFGVTLIGLTPTLLYRMTDPLQLTGFDEQLHLRTLTDLASGHAILLPNPLLAVSTQYPGLESLAVFIHNTTGLPLVGAATAVVLIARLLFVHLLYTLVERLSGSALAAGISVVAYSACQQYFFFNAQFAYQTLAIVFALCAVLLARTSQDLSIIGRDRRIVLLGVALATIGLAITHHVTSWITGGFFLLWLPTVRERHRRRPVLLAGLALLIAVTAWALINLRQLRDYFDPILRSTAEQVSGYISGTSQRSLFKDGSGSIAPSWERVALLGYTGLVCLTAVTVGVIGIKRAYPTRSWPRALAALLALCFPVTFAFRLISTGALFGERSTTFLFLPLAYLIGLLAAEQLIRRSHARPARRRIAATALTAALTAALGFGFFGGVLLGGGPDWEHLPGPYLVSAENRSIDAQTLAAARWANQNLPHGTTITADRMGGVVLAAEGRLWPEVDQASNGADPASLYFANTWTAAQTTTARLLDVGYVYVDQRWADSKPHATVYFHDNESPVISQLTTAQLTKFASLPGAKIAYDSGPIVIYDIRAISRHDGVQGWTGQRHTPPLTNQLIIGALIGLALLGFGRSPAGRAAGEVARDFRRLSGTAASLTLACVLATLIGLGTTAAGLSFGPALSVALLAVLAIPLPITARRRRRARRIRTVRANPRSRPRVGTGTGAGTGTGTGTGTASLLGLSGLVAVTAIAVSVVSAYQVDITQTNRIEHSAVTSAGR